MLLLLAGWVIDPGRDLAASNHPTVIYHTCPDQSLWILDQYSSLNGYGPAPACEGLQALEWFSTSRSPVQFITTARTYISNTLEGEVWVASTVGVTEPFTFTMTLDDVSRQVFGQATLPCYMKVPFESDVSISGIIHRLDCGTLGSGRCYYYVDVSRVDSMTCAPTPTGTATEAPTATETPTDTPTPEP